MIDSHIFQSLILTNTIVAAFCIVLLIGLIGFILVFIVPSIRQRWFGNNEKEEKRSLSRQPSFHNVSLGSSRYNPIFEPAPGATTTTTTTQFGGALFHPQATTATLLHPTIWTSMNPTSALSIQPPAPSHPPNTTSAPPTPQRSPKKR